MKFYNLDLHISVIRDLQIQFSKLGHEIHSENMSGHTWVFNELQDKNEVVTTENWRKIDKAMCDKFYETYKDELSEYDGFVTTYPPVFSMLYEKFNKPIIVYIPIRYEEPYGNRPLDWERLDAFLRKPNVILIANNKYDQMYTKYHVKKMVEFIPNICDYTGVKYADKGQNKFLVYQKDSLIKMDDQFVLREFLKKYDFKDWNDYRAIIHFPYNYSTMSIFEHYSANIPLFFPSQHYLRTLFEAGKNVLSEVTWNQVRKYPCSGWNHSDIFLKNMMYADFYTLPFIQYFDSMEDLKNKLRQANFQTISDNMVQYNKHRYSYTLGKWKEILDSITK